MDSGRSRRFPGYLPHHSTSALLTIALLMIAANAHASCGSNYCLANTHWDTQGLGGDEGLRVDLRYSYAKADKWRAGSNRITPEAPSASGEEIEDRRTINQMLNLDADYAISPSLNLRLQLNARRRARDTGRNANAASGGHSLNLSPGLSYALPPQTQVYGVLQFALRHYANTDPADPASGQLTAPRSLAVGIGHPY